MSLKHSAASKARWAKIPKSERSRRMSEIAKKRMQDMTPQEKKRLGRKLKLSRAAKRV